MAGELQEAPPYTMPFAVCATQILISVGGGGMHEVKRHCCTAKHTETQSCTKLNLENQGNFHRIKGNSNKDQGFLFTEVGRYDITIQSVFCTCST